MKNIIILGNSIAGWAAAKELKRQQAGQITVLSQDGFVPVSRHCLTNRFGNLSRSQGEQRDESLLKDISCLDKKVIRLSLNRKKVTFEDKQQINFDQIILADTGSDQMPQIKGNNKSGVLALNRCSQAVAAAQGLALIETVAVCSQSLHGLRIILRLLENNKEVLWIIPEERVLPEVLDEAMSEVVEKILANSLCRLIKNTFVQEVLGDSDCKAVRLGTGKVMACEMVFFPDVKPDLRLVIDSNLHFKEGRISTDEGMLSSLPGVYAVDRLSSSSEVLRHQNYDTYPEVLEQQGRLAAATILQQTLPVQWPLPEFHVTCGEMSFDWLGDTSSAGHQENIVIVEDQEEACRCLTVRGGQVWGGMFFNKPKMAQNYKTLVEQHVTIDLLPDPWLSQAGADQEPLSEEGESQEQAGRGDQEMPESDPAALAEDPSSSRP